jgi:hypothetical protein
VCINDENRICVFEVPSGQLICTEKGDTSKIVDLEWLSEETFLTVGIKHSKTWSFKGGNLKGKRANRGDCDKLVCAVRSS